MKLLSCADSKTRVSLALLSVRFKLFERSALPPTAGSAPLVGIVNTVFAHL